MELFFTKYSSKNIIVKKRKKKTQIFLALDSKKKHQVEGITYKVIFGSQEWLLPTPKQGEDKEEVSRTGC